MIVQGSSTTFHVAHLQESSRTAQRTVHAWVAASNSSPPASLTRGAAVSAAVGAAVGAAAGKASRAAPSDQRHAALQGRLASVIALLEWLTGHKVHLLDPAELDGGGAGSGTAQDLAPSPAARAARPQAGWGLDMTTTQTSVERESTEVNAAAAITTTGGRTFDVALDLRLDRTATRTDSSRVVAGDAKLTDPLMLGFNGSAGLGAEATPFDLNGDGADEQLPDAAAGSAFLVVDRNGNGLLDDGSELLGPTTGNGFAELAGYDHDGNGWIDEGDAVFARLGLASGGHASLTPLAARGIGAIGLANVASPFTFTSGERVSGALRSTGLWLGEDGSAGAVQQLDVAG